MAEFENVKLFSCWTMPADAVERFRSFWGHAEGNIHWWLVRDDGLDPVGKWLLKLGASDGERVLVDFYKW